MKRVNLKFLIVIILGTKSYSQQKDIADIYLDCIYEKSNIDRKKVEKQIIAFEKYLIKEKLLRDSSPQSYHDLMSTILADKESNLKYSFIDSITNIKNTEKLISHDIECLEEVKKLKEFENSTFGTLNSSKKNNIKRPLLDVNDFKTEFYRLRLLLTINTYH